MNIKNNIQLMGFVGADPVMKKFDTGKTVASFRLATNESFKNSKGVWDKNTTWHTVVGWGNTAERIEKMIKKGSEVLLTGRLGYNEFEDANGVKRIIPEITIEHLEVINRERETKEAA